MEKILFVILFVMLMAWIYYIYYQTGDGTLKNKTTGKPLRCGNEKETESTENNSESCQQNPTP